MNVIIVLISLTLRKKTTSKAVRGHSQESCWDQWLLELELQDL